MKKLTTLIAALVLTIAAGAQTLNVQVGNVTYQFPASQTGEMTYTNGETLTIMGKAFTISDISSMTIDNTKVTDNLVTIAYSGTSATVTVAGNVAQYVTPTISGAYVSIAQSNTDAVDKDEITYQLSGTTTDGQFALSGSYKCTVSLVDVDLTCTTGAAINITNSKRIQLSAKKNTTNTLTDCANGSQKACVYSKGQLQIQGNGTLNVVGNTKHAIKSGDYISIKNLTLNITGAVSDGINCEEYLLIKSGTVTISGVGDDGIQCDLGGDSSTGEILADEAKGIEAHDGEDSGNVYIEGGTINVTCTAAAAKGIKCDGDMQISGGDINVKTTGNGKWDSDDAETKAASGLSCDGNMTVSGGSLTLASSGSGGKGMKCDGVMTISDGTVTVVTSGGLYYNNGTTENTNYTSDTDRISSSYYSSPKGIKAGVKTQSTYAGGLVITGGTVSVTTSGRNGEGIESKNYLNITGGQVTVNSYDDAINSAQDLTIEGGYVYAHATNNDGLDANGNCYIKGGVVYAVGSSSPEVAIDANSEQQKKLYITGGTIIAVGGLESGSSISGGTCKYTSSWTSNSWYALYNGSDLALAFKTPASSSSSGGGGGPWGGGGPGGGPGGGGGGSQQLVVYTSSTPALQSGVTVSDGTEYFGGMANVGGTVSGGSSVSLSAYSGGNSGPGWH